MAGYTGYRKVPRKVVITGDKDAGRTLIGAADSQLRILEQQMTFQGLKQAYRTVRPYPGVTIYCWSCFTLQGVTISTEGGKKQFEEQLRECWCNCNFAVGKIMEVYEDLKDYRVLDVIACNNEVRYVRYENILGTDWTPWEKGMPVILMAYAGKIFRCDHSDFASLGSSKGCRPIDSGDTDDVLSGSTTLHEEGWYPTYRVVPICGLNTPKWVNV